MNFFIWRISQKFLKHSCPNILKCSDDATSLLVLHWEALSSSPLALKLSATVIENCSEWFFWSFPHLQFFCWHSEDTRFSWDIEFLCLNLSFSYLFSCFFIFVLSCPSLCHIVALFYLLNFYLIFHVYFHSFNLPEDFFFFLNVSFWLAFCTCFMSTVSSIPLWGYLAVWFDHFGLVSFGFLCIVSMSYTFFFLVL